MNLDFSIFAIGGGIFYIDGHCEEKVHFNTSLIKSEEKIKQWSINIRSMEDETENK